MALEQAPALRGRARAQAVISERSVTMGNEFPCKRAPCTGSDGGGTGAGGDNKAHAVEHVRGDGWPSVSGLIEGFIQAENTTDAQAKELSLTLIAGLIEIHEVQTRVLRSAFQTLSESRLEDHKLWNAFSRA